MINFYKLNVFLIVFRQLSDDKEIKKKKELITPKYPEKRNEQNVNKNIYHHNLIFQNRNVIMFHGTKVV